MKRMEKHGIFRNAAGNGKSLLEVHSDQGPSEHVVHNQFFDLLLLVKIGGRFQPVEDNPHLFDVFNESSHLFLCPT